MPSTVSFLAGLLLAAAPGLALAQSGGPDAFGYVYGPTAYDFVPLAGVGDPVVFTPATFVQEVIVPLPFPFEWYGDTWTNVKVGAHGTLALQFWNIAVDNVCDMDPNHAAVAVYWDELNVFEPGAGVYTWHDVANDRFIVSWEDVSRAPSIGTASFQAHLHPDGSVEMHWADTGFGHGLYDHGGSATIGISDDSVDSTAAGQLVWSCDTPQTLEGTALACQLCGDGDGDGFFDAGCGGTDCADADPAVHPDATEVCNGLDDDCDPATDEDGDPDGDGVSLCAGDCDPEDAAFFPGNAEQCDAVDQDCDGDVDEGLDADGDGVTPCGPDGVAGTDDDDCDDGDATVLPGAAEVCDGLDTDCTAAATGTWEEQPTGFTGTVDGPDGTMLYTRISLDDPGVLSSFAWPVQVPGGTPLQWVVYERQANGDYTQLLNVPGEAAANPAGDWLTSPPLGAGLAAGNFLLALHVDGIGSRGVAGSTPTLEPTPFGTIFTSSQVEVADPPAVMNWSSTYVRYPMSIVFGEEIDADVDGWLDCEDCDDVDAAVSPDTAEACDGADNDCDGLLLADEHDADGDGSYLCDATPDCDDFDASRLPGQPELCDENDNDCDGIIPPSEWDVDGDGYLACEDCDDGDVAFNPGAGEQCDGLDTDCDGQLGPAMTIENPWLNLTQTITWIDEVTRGVRITGTGHAVVSSVEFHFEDWTGGDLHWGIYTRSTPTGTTYTRQWFTEEYVPAVQDTWVASPPLDWAIEPGETVLLLIGYYDELLTYERVGSISSADQPAWGTLSAWFEDDEYEFDQLPTISGWGAGAGIPFRLHVEGEGDADGDGVIDCQDCAVDDPTAAAGFPELCDTVDNDCDGSVDEDFAGQDADGDGFLACADDCDDADATAFPGGVEVCDGADNDCDGADDDGLDGDGDGVTPCGPDGLAGTADDDCDDADPAVLPGAPEGCNGVDNDCDGSVGPNELDNDGDGVVGCEDCDDADATVFPGAGEICNGFDDDCDGLVPPPELADADGDGFLACADCDDADPATYLFAPELCDGLDNDCDGQLPANEADADADGYRVCEGDCNDASAAANPAGTEVCDGVDNDCDGSTDDLDADGDGWACDDCDDDDPAVYPGAPELCNGADDDCDVTTGAPGGEHDGDEDGARACEDCDDADVLRTPGAVEQCDGLDNDCDGQVPADEADADGDGYFACGECDDDDPDRVPGGDELCDGVDNDCDGDVPADEQDADGDGVAPCDGDCDDGDAATYPGAPEECDGVDNDCDGDIGEENLDEDADGITPCAGDCDDTDASIYPDAPEVCDGVDSACDGLDDEADEDGDGYYACGGDCDDGRAELNPAQSEDTDEACNDNLDNDCDGDADYRDDECEGLSTSGGGSSGRARNAGCSAGGGGGVLLLWLVALVRRRSAS